MDKLDLSSHGWKPKQINKYIDYAFEKGNYIALFKGDYVSFFVMDMAKHQDVTGRFESLVQGGKFKTEQEFWDIVKEKLSWI